jgi:tetratricopeptide (TPR) repeat protein
VYSGLDDPDGARRGLEDALARAPQASPREQRRIALRAKQLEALDELGNVEKHLAYKKAIDAALALDIAEPELWLVRGNAEEPTAAGRGQRGGAASTAFYLEALRLAPDSAAAHHYLTHSYEGIAQIPQALEHGEAYARLAPAVPHAHHMWGHDLRRVGRIDDAIAAFRRTYELERAYYASEAIPPSLDWHHVHNLDLLATSHQHKGQVRQAERLLREAGGLAPVTEYLEFNQKALATFLLGRARWADALVAADGLIAGSWPSTRAVGRALGGHALLALGREAEARAALEAAERELGALPGLVAGINISRGSVAPYVDTLRGELMLRGGDRAQGRQLLMDVQQQLRALPGPDAWIQALFRLEAIARIAREAGDWELAEHTARQMLDHDSAYGGGHLALALVARQRGDHETARREADRARSFWRDADPDFAESALLRDIGGEAAVARATSN